MKFLLLVVSWFALLPSFAASAADVIDWQHWELQAFAEAKATNKIILVSVGMEGCPACARMEALTYTDRTVIELINKSFVAIEVDAEARPDIGERYSDWVWGGSYIASFPEEMEVPAKFAALRAIPEKRILVQANAITAFAIGYQHTGDEKYLAGINDIDRFLKQWMLAPDGTFYTNHKEPTAESAGKHVY